jgi:ribonuclease D
MAGSTPDATAVADAARAAGRLGIDTEFMAERRYRALLCLVQVAVPGEEVAILDPLAGDDLQPLAGVLADPDVEVVLHAGRQDVAILRRVLGTEVRNAFDTQVAAGFAGMSAQAGYETLLSSVLRIRLPKSASFTRWDRRPLNAEQLRYAREDVLNLLELAEELQRRLVESGRLEWAREECRRLEEASDERDPEALLLRLPRVSGLSGGQRAVALELLRWREEVAAEQDRPYAQILGDQPLVEIAKRRPDDLRALEEIRGVHPETLRRRGQAILAAVQRSEGAPPVALDEERRPPPDPRLAPLVALAESVVRARALEAGLAYELVAARADLARVVELARNGGPEPDVRTLQGWRRELVGSELLELLEGRHAVAVGDDGKLAVTPAS